MVKYLDGDNGADISKPNDEQLAYIEKVRGHVIELSIKMERMVGIIISYYYFKKINIEFIQDVIFDPRFTAGFLRDIFNKTGYPDRYGKDFKKNFNRLIEIRNNFAHCMIIVKEGKLMFSFDKPVHYKEIKDELDEFDEVIERVSKVLARLIRDLGIDKLLGS